MANLVAAKWFRPNTVPNFPAKVREGVDLHVLPNFDGPDLRKWLIIRVKNGQARWFNLDAADADPAIDVIFEPYFRYKMVGTSLRGFGVEVNSDSGKTKFDLSIADRNPARDEPTDADLRLHNFLLYAHINGPHPTKPAPTLS